MVTEVSAPALERRSRVNWVDFVMIGVLAALLLYGITRGFVRQILGIITIAVALVLAARFAPGLAESKFFDSVRAKNAKAPQVISFLSIFIAAAVGSGI